MNLRPAGAAAALFLGASALGRRPEEMRFDDTRHPPGARVRRFDREGHLAQANLECDFTGALLCPAPQLTRMRAGDPCRYDGQFICKDYGASVASGPSLRSLPIGGCCHRREIRFPGAPSSATVPDSKVICGTRFTSGQPYLAPDVPR